MAKKKSAGSATKKRRPPSQAQIALVTLISTADRIRNSFEKVRAPFEITGQQYNVLRILRGAGPSGLPTLTIAERMVERTPGITGLVDRLEAKGLVVREIPGHDRRLVYCRIAKKGLSLLKLLDDPMEAGNRKAFSGLNSKELQQLILLLDKARKPHED